MDHRDTIKTGDVVLFSGNTPTGFLLKTFVSSEWNHSGIAVRFKTIPDPDDVNNFKKVISLNEEGELYILETNTGIRKDDIFGYDIVGAGFSKADWAFNKYNKISVRRLRDIFRTQQLSALTLEFANKNRGNKFPGSSLPFLSVWLGIPLSEKNTSEMFCSELMAHYYQYCIGPQYERITGMPYEGKLSTLFGSDSPISEDMFQPGHYTSRQTPNASIFVGSDELIYLAYADMWYVILQPLILALFVILLIWMSLPKS